MLAAIGFTLTGICFAVFAYTFYAFVVKKTKLKFHGFAVAYKLLALAFIVWGLASATADPNFLASSVIIGNGLIVLGTVAMLSVLPDKIRLWAVGVGGFTLVALLFVRIMYYLPEPYMRDGILVFNTPAPVAAVLGAVFLLIWLPVNVYVSRQVAHAIHQDAMAPIYSWIYGAATLASLVFLSARRTVTIILSFTAIGVCFAMLVASNVLADKLKVHHGRSK
jgi:hypothetical protein